MTSNPPSPFSSPKLGASVLFDDLAPDVEDDSNNEGDVDHLPSEPPSDWEFYDESRPMTPEDLADDRAFLGELQGEPSMAATPSRKRQASEPSLPAASSSTHASLGEHPLKRARSKSTWAKEQEKGGEDWPPRMLSE